MYFDDDDDYSFGSDNYVSPLSGQSVYISGDTYTHYNYSFLPENVKLVLPNGFRLHTTYDDDGNENTNLQGEVKYDDNGEEAAGFSCSFAKVDVNVEDRDKCIKAGTLKEGFEPGLIIDQTTDSMLDTLKENMGQGRKVKITDLFPATTILEFYKPVSLFGITFETFAVEVLIEVSENLLFGLTSVYQKDDEGNDQYFKDLLTVIKSVRVDEKPIQIGSLTAKKLEKALDMDADESSEVITIGAQINIDLDAGDSKTRFTINSDGSTTESVIEAPLKYAFADEKLYPHYNSMLRTSGLGMLGVNVVVNSTGTEYCFHQINEYVSDEASDKVKAAVKKLNDTKAGSYKLADKAVEMRGLFHVSESAFDEKHDRECELAEDYMHRAYMMSALRSFAWTLAAYCDDMSIKPADVDLEHIHKIISFVKDNNWLNYDDSNYCKGLCGTQDLHVFYLPDKTPKSVKDVFLPDKKTLDDTKKMQEKFPTYNPILEQVGSLDELRKDLDYIYPAIEKIFDELCESRDPNVPLEGDAADILYAWCAVAYAARGPFFSEDGPMNCWFTQIKSDFDLSKHRGKAPTAGRSTAKAKTASKSGKAVFSTIPVAEVPDSRKKLINGNKKEKYPVRFFYFFETGDEWGRSKAALYYRCEQAKPGFRSATENLYGQAVQYLDAFDDDTKRELQNGLLRDTKPIHALRSFIWSAVEAAGNGDKQSIDVLSEEDMKELLIFIAQHGFANYKPASTTSQRFGGQFLRKEEVKAMCSSAGGNSFNSDCIKDFDCGYTRASGMDLIELSDDLEALKPNMDTVYSILNSKCDDDVREAALSVLQGWCIYALHCRASFFSMPAKYALDINNRGDISEAIKAEIKPVYLDDNRYTVVSGVVVEMNDERSRIVIPEGVRCIVAKKPVNELLSRAEEVVYPKSFEGIIAIPENLRKVIVNSDAEWIRVDTNANGWNKEYALTEVQFTGNIKTLRGGFSFCKHLTKVTLPKNLENIPFFMFSYCESLKEIALPDSIKTIERNAFSNSGIKEIKLPRNLHVIEREAFSQTEIRDLTLPPDIETIDDVAFDDQKTNLTIHLYKGSKTEESLDKYCAERKRIYKESQREFGSNAAVRMHIDKLEAPWAVNANNFVDSIEKMYDAPDDQDKMKAEISKMIDPAFDMDYDQVRDSALEDAEERNLTTLCNVLKECDNMSMLKEKLPVALAAEIPAEAKKRAYEKKHAMLTSEIKSIKDRIEVLDKSISDYNSTMAELQAELNKKEQELQEKHEQYDALIEEKTRSWKIANEELQEEISDSKLYLEKLHEQITEKKNELSGLSFLQFGRKKELTQIIEGLGREVNSEQNNRDKLVNKRNKAEKDYHTAVNGPKNAISVIGAEIENLKNTIDSLSDKLSGEKQEFEEKKGQLPELEKELEELKY